MTTKNDERKALEEIRKIVEALGADSYVASAFEGCFDLAEMNIRDDAAYSMKRQAENAEQQLEGMTEELKELEAAKRKADSDYEDVFEENRHLRGQLSKAEAKIEELMKWVPCDSKTGYSQAAYDDLAKSSICETLSDREAAQRIEDDFGFCAGKVTIIHEVAGWQRSETTGEVRKNGTVKRDPLYGSSDWNCIVFSVRGYTYMMKNGELEFFDD